MTQAPETDFENSEHITHTLAPPITDLNGAYGVVQVHAGGGYFALRVRAAPRPVLPRLEA